MECAPLRILFSCYHCLCFAKIFYCGDEAALFVLSLVIVLTFCVDFFTATYGAESTGHQNVSVRVSKAEESLLL